MGRVLAIGDIHGAYKALVQVLERSGFNRDEDRLITLGDVCDGWPETKKCIDELLSIPNHVHIIGNHDCLSEDTELLTKRGWVTYDLIEESDHVYSINKSENKGEWVPITEIIVKHYMGKMKKLETSSIDLLCTPNHRIIYDKRVSNGIKKYWNNNKLDFISNVNSGRIRIRRSIDSEKIGLNITDDELRVIAWILTDGGQDKRGIFHIYQSKPKFVNRIRDMLNRLNYNFYEYTRDRDIEFIEGKKLINKPLKAYHFSMGVETSSLIRKYLPSKYPFHKNLFNMNRRQLDIFLEELSYGDGSQYGDRANNGTYRIYGLKPLLDSLQILCVTGGYSASIHTNDNGHHALNTTKRPYCNLDISNKVTDEDYNGNVWCLRVPNENFMVRRNGKSFFTGNCWSLNWMTSGWMQPIWTKQGGQATIDSYNLEQVVEWVPPNIPIEHIKFLRNSTHAIELDDNRLLVHGGIDWKTPLEDHTINELVWDRELVRQAWIRDPIKGRKKGVTTYKEVFVGHTTTEAYDDKLVPLNYCEVWLLDTGAGWSGKLTIMDIDTKEYWQSDLVSTLYPDDKGRSFD